ncbi:MAG: methyltransferase domain-containing protein [Dehalococcoidia bacterium]|nr:methyltransferase domain-containing protein [Dehalococcoidia bacterium]
MNAAADEAYARKLLLSDVLREPVIRAAIEALELPPGSRGLDAGCGIGSHTLLLAKAVAPTGHVTGVDMCPEFLARARERAAKSRLSERVTFREGDISSLPFADDSFDWAWSVDCVGFIPTEPVALLKELMRVVKPGASVAVLVWSSQQLLPGHPLLEARLNASSAGIAPFRRGDGPESHFLRALGWFRAAGFEATVARTFAGDACAPLSGDIRDALLSLIEMRWGKPQSELAAAEWEEFARLSRPESPDFILNLPDYYAFFTYSMFRGRVPR